MGAAPGAQFQKGGQAARRKAAPPGAAALNGSEWVSMCQIACVRRRGQSLSVPETADQAVLPAQPPLLGKFEQEFLPGLEVAP